MSANHTPGPWKWRNESLLGDQSGPICEIINSEGCTVFRDTHPDEFQPIFEANKRLIAAAPDLFEALTVAEEFMSGFEGDASQDGIDAKLTTIRIVLSKARNAIANAKGVEA